MGNLASLEASMEQHNVDERPPNKRARCESVDGQQSPADPNAKRITDLDEHCLEEIFGYLNFQSLFSVAIANGILRPAAANVYKRRFGRFAVEITGNGFMTDRRPIFVLNKLIVDQLKSALQFLRCFGSAITALEFDAAYYSKGKRYEYIHQYINKYCAESLVKISFKSVSKIDKKHFPKPFRSVENVTVTGGSLARYLPSFSVWFPNMRHLTLYRLNMYGKHFTDFHFGNLQRLSILPFTVGLFTSEREKTKLKSTAPGELQLPPKIR